MAFLEGALLLTTYEQARDTALALAESTRGFDGNEATTRFRLINTLLTDVLGWAPDEIACEEHVNGDYLDYVLGDPERWAVVEAKRTSRTFDVPAGVSAGLIDLPTIRDHSAGNKLAVDQVLAYCQESGIGMAVLSNGHQLLAFLGSRSDGRKPVDGKALFYPSLDNIHADFPRFWDSLSRDGLIRGDLSAALQRNLSAPPPPPPLSSRIAGYPGFRIGTEMETDLRILGDLFLQDITREETITEDFLRDCYCASGALSQYAVVSKEILRSRYAVLSQHVNTESATDKKGANPAVKEDLIASALVKRPIILLGDVGVGKSIFLKHLLRIDAEELLDRTIVFYVDFLQHSGLVDDVPKYLVAIITNTLNDSLSIDIDERDFVRSVYNREINAFKRGIYGALEEDDPREYRMREISMFETRMLDRYEHARRSLRFLQGSRGLNFVVVLDNVDQHLATFQEQIFVAGQSLAETWPTAVFMSLRPDTFHASRRSGALAAYQPRVFTVSPPRSDHVIVKRLAFARKQLVEFGRLPGFPEGLTLDSESLLVYVDVLIAAFEQNEKLISLVDNLSSGNTRRALDYISTFVGSGYVQTERILQANRDGRQYVIPLHEFIRAIMYGVHKHYDPSSSPVTNVFWISRSDGKEHFLTPLILATTDRLGQRESGGFVELSAVYRDLQGLGYAIDQIDIHLRRARERDLVEISEPGGSGKIIRINAAGGYLHRVLAANFAYIDAVVVDTPVIDPETRSLVRDVYDIEERVERAETFVAYLSSVWPFGTDAVAFSWPHFVESFAHELQAVRGGVARAEKRRNTRDRP